MKEGEAVEKNGIILAKNELFSNGGFMELLKGTSTLNLILSKKFS